MSEVRLHVYIVVDDDEVAKRNRKRAALGRAYVTGADEAINAVSDALSHNYLFEGANVESRAVVVELLKAIVEAGQSSWRQAVMAQPDDEVCE